MPSLPKGPIAVRGHGLAPTVAMRWRRLDKHVKAEIATLRIELGRAKVAADTYTEHLLHTFGTCFMEEHLLSAQLAFTIQKAETLQAQKQTPDTWMPLLNAGLKVAATLKGSRYHKLLALRELLRLANPKALPEKDVSLTEYLAEAERAERAQNAAFEKGPTKRTVQASADPPKETQQPSTPPMCHKRPLLQQPMR